MMVHLKSVLQKMNDSEKTGLALANPVFIMLHNFYDLELWMLHKIHEVRGYFYDGTCETFVEHDDLAVGAVVKDDMGTYEGLRKAVEERYETCNVVFGVAVLFEGRNNVEGAYVLAVRSF